MQLSTTPWPPRGFCFYHSGAFEFGTRAKKMALNVDDLAKEKKKSVILNLAKN